MSLMLDQYTCFHNQSQLWIFSSITFQTIEDLKMGLPTKDLGKRLRAYPPPHPTKDAKSFTLETSYKNQHTFFQIDF